MWFIVAFGRALDHVFFPGFKRQPVREPVFIVAPPAQRNDADAETHEPG